MGICGIILAGGKSSRMGEDKALLEIEGVPLLQRAIDLCKPICSRIIVSSNSQDHQKFNYPLIADEIENCGPIGGLYSGLRNSKCEWNLVISVDSPFVEPEFLKFMLSKREEFQAVVPYSNRGKEPLIALYHKSCKAELKKRIFAKEYKMHGFINSVNTNYVDSSEWVKKYPKLFHNLNRPEDLKADE